MPASEKPTHISDSCTATIIPMACMTGDPILSGQVASPQEIDNFIQEVGFYAPPKTHLRRGWLSTVGPLA